MAAAMAAGVGATAPASAADQHDHRPAAGTHRIIIHTDGGSSVKDALRATAGAAGPQRLDAVRRSLDLLEADLAPIVAAGELVVRRRMTLQPAVAATATDAAIAMLRGLPRVSVVEPDRRWTTQTFEGLQVIGADVLHQLGVAGQGTAVAIIDSGIDYLHPTLGGGQIPNAKVVLGLDTADGDHDPMDCTGHGTAVASVAAGSSYQWSPNRRFAGGVAPAAKILAYKVTSDAECDVAYTSAVVAAIEDAVLHRTGDDYRLAAINISLGGGRYEGPCDADNVAYSAAVRTALAAGIAVVAASGNNGYPDALHVPACLDGVLSVASAWDTDAGQLGFVFCLDGDCNSICDDSFSYRTAITCYSNTSPRLDLVAPSEFLKAASASGVTADFGGTSGASAYAAGAVALLHDALDRPSPEAVRFLLHATGVPVMDDKNGVVRSVIDLEAAVAAAERVAIAEPVALPVPSAAASRTSSPLTVDADGVVGSLKVHLELNHPDPTRLRVRLVAPDGMSVLLHDHSVGTGGIVGTYPDDLTPVESLGRLSGVVAFGSWSLEVDDDGTPAGGGTADVSVAWALEIAEPTSPVPERTTMVFPVAAHLDGAMGTKWRSDLRIFNPIHRRTTEVRLHLIPLAGDAIDVPRQTDVVVPHSSVVALNDVVLTRFGADATAGTVVVEDDTGTMVHGVSRTYTESVSGTYGQFIAPEVGAVDSTGAGEPALIVLPTGGADHRVNIGVTEITGSSATVAMTLIDSDTGVAIGPSRFFELEGFSNLQINGVLPSLEVADDTELYVAVAVVRGDGRITAYGSVIDNRSGDAVFISAATPQVAPFLLVPVVARTEGQAGTVWRSDLRVLNHGAFSVHVDAELRLQGAVGVPPVPASFELQPGQARSIEDVVGTLFGLDSAAGSLLLIPREGATALCASSRTANHGGDSGSYGQFVPALPAGSGLRGRGVVLNVDKGPNIRTNFGLVETDGLSIGVRFQLYDHHGAAFGAETRMTLGPWESVQLNDVFSALGAPSGSNARVEITRDSGDGGFYAYASVVDGLSGDAVFVPVQAIDPAP